MKTPAAAPASFDRFALQDAFGYAVCLAGYEMTFVPSDRTQAEWNRLAITTLKAAGYAGPLFTALKPRERGKRLAWAAHDLGRWHGIDAYTGERPRTQTGEDRVVENPGDGDFTHPPFARPE
jgi:hypothetical protein